MKKLQYVAIAFLPILMSAGTSAWSAAILPGVSLAPLCPPSFLVTLPCTSFEYGGIKFDYYACSGAAGGKVVHLQSAYCNQANPGKVMCVYDNGTGLWGPTQSCGAAPPPPPPPPTCLPGYTGTPPHCYPRGRCPLGTYGTFPNCTNNKCPAGLIGTPPNCKKPIPIIQCRAGTFGTPPNCKPPLTLKVLPCPRGYTGASPNCIKEIIH